MVDESRSSFESSFDFFDFQKIEKNKMMMSHMHHMIFHMGST
jgi:hypothetical protein